MDAQTTQAFSLRTAALTRRWSRPPARRSLSSLSPTSRSTKAGLNSTGRLTADKVCLWYDMMRYDAWFALETGRHGYPFNLAHELKRNWCCKGKWKERNWNYERWWMMDDKSGHYVMGWCVDIWKTYGRRSFSYAGPSAWNALPDYLKNSTLSLSVFRSQLKHYLFSSY